MSVRPGAVYRFTRSAGGDWTFASRITPPPTAVEDGMCFGYRVDGSGDILAVSARHKTVGSVQDAGAAYIYHRDAATDSFNFVSEVVSPTPTAGAWLGWGLALHGPTGRLALGAPREGDKGTIYTALVDGQGNIGELSKLQPDIGSSGELGVSLAFTRSGSLLAGDPSYVCRDGCQTVGGIMRFCGPIDELRLVEVVRTLESFSSTIGFHIGGGDHWCVAGSSSSSASGVLAEGAVAVFNASNLPNCERSFLGEVYCGAKTIDCSRAGGLPGSGCPNSATDGASLRVGGLPRVGPGNADGFVAGLPSGATCVLLVGDFLPSSNLPPARPLGDGVLCIGSAHSRFAPRAAASNGSIQYTDLFSEGSPYWPTTQRFVLQAWYRDAASPAGRSNLTNAVVLRLAP